MPEKLNQAGSMDFLHERSTDGRAFKLFNMTDDHNRKELTGYIGFPLPIRRGLLI
uniref:hypothetical protein n=1 Tax=uncultured Psychrobacter sp. TaxID=259303 RepID=UPI0025931168|nr:hypothetical protein [uncultured Psychrobacter sp.]